MSTNQQRRGRVRLARQRPAPSRVRRRSVAADDWLLGLPWTTIGTVVGAMAAIGGLIFSGVATYYSAVVAQQQLEQTREDSEKEDRSQAARVNFWTEEPAKGSEQTLHLMNRSLDPVTDITALLWGDSDAGIQLEVLPPCSELDLKLSELTQAIDGGRIKLPSGEFSIFMQYTDSDGKLWERSQTELTEGDEEDSEDLAGDKFTLPPYSVARAHVTKTAPLKECGLAK
ncbi:hypothetical protein ABT127_26065 [Streptomyces sp. NPDC001904]|uniref:hypothetical protein n=1 Tax=Streptomyces sp. NPDC001904 TaxID=3154531 RepID=UPI003323801A